MSFFLNNYHGTNYAKDRIPSFVFFTLQCYYVRGLVAGW